MAHSIQVFHGKSGVFNDLDLMVIVGLAAQVNSRVDDAERFGKFMEDWQMSLKYYGPGLIDLHLEELLVTTAAKQDLAALLQRISRQIEDYGDEVPLPILKRMIPVRGVIFVAGYKTAFLREAVSELQTLVGTCGVD